MARGISGSLEEKRMEVAEEIAKILIDNGFDEDEELIDEIIVKVWDIFGIE